MSLDELEAVIERHKYLIGLWKSGLCSCGNTKNPRLYHFNTGIDYDAIVRYCDNCFETSKKHLLRELEGKEYFVVRMYDY